MNVVIFDLKAHFKEADNLIYIVLKTNFENT